MRCGRCGWVMRGSLQCNCLPVSPPHSGIPVAYGALLPLLALHPWLIRWPLSAGRLILPQDICTCCLPCLGPSALRRPHGLLQQLSARPAKASSQEPSHTILFKITNHSYISIPFLSAFSTPEELSGITYCCTHAHTCAHTTHMHAHRDTPHTRMHAHADIHTQRHTQC